MRITTSPKRLYRVTHKCWTPPIGGVVLHCVCDRGVVALGSAQSDGAPFFLDKKLMNEVPKTEKQLSHVPAL